MTPPITLIYCRGGCKQAPLVAAEAGIAYGIRYDYVAYGDVYMLDTGPGYVDWPRYVQRVRDLQPVMALTLDYYSPLRADYIAGLAQELKDLGVERVAVCPKFHGACSLIPADCVIAVSIPTTYAGFLPTPDEVGDRPVHLLGGHPDQVKLLMNRYSNVVSADMNIVGRKAALGQYWGSGGGWVTSEKHSMTAFDLAVLSWRNIQDYLSKDCAFRSRRTHRLMYKAMLI